MVKVGDIIKKYRKALSVLGRIISVIVALALVVVCNMLTNINAEDFNFKAEFFKNLKDPLTWVLSMSIAMSWAIIYAVVFSFIKDRKIIDNANLFAEYEELNKNKPHNFGDYLKRVENPIRKETAYIAKMEKALAKVQYAMENMTPERQNGRKYKKLVEKERQIIERSTPEYINTHFLCLSVKYNRVLLEHFTFAITSAKVTDKTKSDEQSKFARKIVSKVILGILIGISGISILSSLTVMFDWKDTGLWVTLIMIVLSIFMQIYFASIDADSIVDSEIIAPTKIKMKIIQESLLWKEADMTNKPFLKLVEKYMEENKPKEEPTKKTTTITQAQLDYLNKHREEIDQKIKEEEDNNGDKKD